MAEFNLAEVHRGGGYGSEFEYDSEAERKRKKYEDLAKKEKKSKDKKAHKRLLEDEYEREERKIHRHHILSMDAYDRHKTLINNYLMYYGGSKSEFKRDTSRDRTDMDVIRENHKFLWTEEDESDDSWEKRLAKKYYDKLFREYCIADLSRYKENKIAMRWRIEKEVEEGKGQFVCGNKRCKETAGLRSWEVNFAYLEQGVKRNALVKLRLCPDCSYKLNYHHRKKEIVPKKKQHDKKSTDKDGKRRKSSHSSKTEEEPSHRTEEGEQDTSKGDNSASGSEEGDASIWSGPAKVTEEKSREEEFDDYFADMFL